MWVVEKWDFWQGEDFKYVNRFLKELGKLKDYCQKKAIPSSLCYRCLCERDDN